MGRAVISPSFLWIVLVVGQARFWLLAQSGSGCASSPVLNMIQPG